MGELRKGRFQLLELAQDIRTETELPNKAVAFAARGVVQATLPHQNPRGNPPVWSRRNGNYTLIIRPGYETNQRTGREECIGYPYGSIPRLLLFWMTTEAVRTKRRTLELGGTLKAFMEDVGLDPSRGGKRSDARRLPDQMRRLFNATISFQYKDDEQQSWLNMNVTSTGALCWNPNEPNQLDLFQSGIELSPEFYKAITDNSFPADKRALKALRKSPLALDLYAWLIYRTYRVNQQNRPQRIAWVHMKEQFGAGIADTRNFARHAKAALLKISDVYENLNVQVTRGGIIIQPGVDMIPARTLHLYTFKS